MTQSSTPPEPYLVSLRARLQRFPERRAAVTRVDVLKRQLARVTDLHSENTSIRQRREHLISVFPDVDTSASTRQLQNVQSRATAFLSLLETPGDSLSDTKVQDAVIELTRAVQGAAKAVAQEWSQQVGAVVSKYERLSYALQRAGVRGSKELLSAIERVRAMQEPPNSLNGAQRASEDIASLKHTLTQLGFADGLSGKVGDCLTAVADGRGSAKALLDPEVQAFLEAYDLWSVLVVSFR